MTASEVDDGDHNGGDSADGGKVSQIRFWVTSRSHSISHMYLLPLQVDLPDMVEMDTVVGGCGVRDDFEIGTKKESGPSPEKADYHGKAGFRK